MINSPLTVVIPLYIRTINIIILMQMVYSVIVAVRQRGNKNKFLLIRRPISGHNKIVWTFPSGNFDERINGSMVDAVSRILEMKTNLTVNTDKIRHLGNFVRPEPEKDRILLGYAYIVEDYEGDVEFLKELGDFKWVDKPKILGMKNISEDTKTFLKLFKI